MSLQFFVILDAVLHSVLQVLDDLFDEACVPPFTFDLVEGLGVPIS